MIYWLASYPRSGNTWSRAVLTSLMAGAPDRPPDILSLSAAPVAISRDAFDTEFDCTSSEMKTDEIDRLRHDFHLRLAERARAPLLVKLHCAYRHASDGRPIFPSEATKGVVLIVRNPLDVAVSLAPFLDLSLDAAIDWMAQIDAKLSGQNEGSTPGLPQCIGTWSAHTASWLDQSALPLHLVRYEDLVADPLSHFSALAAFVGLDVTPEQVTNAVAQSRIELLQAQEIENAGRTRFFRRGGAGGWRDALTPAQSARLRDDHHAMMQRLGYAD